MVLSLFRPRPGALVALDPSTHALAVDRYARVRLAVAGLPGAFVFTSDPA